ncbi:MAG: DUF2066 domain-containing protein, partial [Alphaproteobacteria bacterium]
KNDSNIAEMGPFAMRLLLIIFTVLSLFTEPAQAQNEASFYEVTDVAVDVTADSAAKARDQAIMQAQRAAFSQLLERLGTSASLADKLKNEDIATLVKNFEVQNERTSPVRYIGTFSVQFRPTAVRTYLANENASYNETQGKPILVFPVTISGGKPILWEEKTRWRSSWETNARNGSALPIIVPTGNPGDVVLLSSADAVSGKSEAIKALIEKYQTNGAAVVILDTDLSKPGTELKVRSVHYDTDGNAAEAVNFTLPAPADQFALDTALLKAVKQTRRQLEKDWQESVTVTEAPAQTTVTETTVIETRRSAPGAAHLPITVLIDSLSQWALIKRKLDSIPYIDYTNVIALQRGSGQIEIEFHGSIDALQLALMQQNLTLKQDSNRIWTLRQTPGAMPY